MDVARETKRVEVGCDERGEGVSLCVAWVLLLTTAWEPALWWGESEVVEVRRAVLREGDDEEG